MYQLHGNLKAIEGNGEKLQSILLEASRLLSTIKGCRLYVVGKDKNNEDTVWITEIWESKEEHEESLKLGPVKELIKQAMPILDGIPQQGQELEIIGGYFN